ncbi:uncharacterized protein LOC103929076 isoform X3 [Pyrus x bretschneideri]|uniref:uncharacterized protein LOC103929076 isoform X3 n=1 Tax=Pyrus x bretschneideri TaxID=225117 RepID=UPI0020308098|nr:uncharacterized protein LOC103929076 isoform X3 [Pyrus x bretschneideri]
MKLAPSILFLSLSFSSFLSPATARGGLHSSYPPGFEFGPRAGSGRQLFEDKEAQTRVDAAQGYLTNSDLGRPIKEFGRRDIPTACR